MRRTKRSNRYKKKIKLSRELQELVDDLKKMLETKTVPVFDIRDS